MRGRMITSGQEAVKTFVTQSRALLKAPPWASTALRRVYPGCYTGRCSRPGLPAVVLRPRTHLAGLSGEREVTHAWIDRHA
jgi:hypothetical protein